MDQVRLETEYIEAIHKIRELAKPELTPEMSDAELLEQIQRNAAQSYELMRANNRILDELLFSRRAEQLSDEDIAGLIAFADKLFNYGMSDDCGIAYKIHSLLLMAARMRGDDALIIRELYYCGLCLFYTNELHLPDGTRLFSARIRGYFKEAALNYFIRYEDFDEKTRDYIIRCLGNRKICMMRQTTEQCMAYYRVVDDAMGIMRSGYYHELNPNLPWNNYVYSMRMDQITMLHYLRDAEHPDEYIAQRALEAAEHCYRDRGLYTPHAVRLRDWQVEYFYHAACYHAGVETARALVDCLLTIVENSPMDDFTNRGINTHLTVVAYIIMYSHRLSAEAQAELKPRIDPLLGNVMKYLSRAQAMASPKVVNEALHYLVEETAEMEAADIKWVFRFFLVGHSPTYIHSLMVALLTARLTRRLLQTTPLALAGVLGCTTAEQLRARAGEIEELAYNCGLYHDLGKSMVLMYISDNTRRLLDEEFECIKQHPAYGYSLLCKLGHEKDYAQAALYHHSYYDGTGGYPLSFGPCPADMKPIVDVLTVADSLEAATDSIGRCYASSKPYEVLIGEIRAQSGTRYSPAVAAVFDDAAFSAELKQLLYSERARVYAEVYRSVSSMQDDAGNGTETEKD